MKKQQDTLQVLIVVQILLMVVIIVQLGSLSNTLTGGIVVGDTGKAAAPTPSAPAPSVPAPADVDMEKLADSDAFKGKRNAPVTIVEFSDFECPFCQRFYQQTLPSIQEKYIDTGKVKLVYRDFPLSFHPNAQKAAEASECAKEQGKYWEMHDLMFDNGVKGGVAQFKQFATDLGLNQGKFDECLDSGKMASEVQQDMKDGQAAGISGTPGFIVNGRKIVGAQPFPAFEAAIEAALKE